MTLAAAGGILCGAADVSIKALTGLASHHGTTAALTSPWLTAPIVVASTLVVFAIGILLLIAGLSGRGQYLFSHWASFVIWLCVTAVHVVGHLIDLRRSLLPTHEPSALSRSSPGAAGRWLAHAMVGGLVLAIELIPKFAAWTANAAFLHHHG